MLSLIIGVILDNFANIGSDNKPITVEQLEEFREVWLKYDPKGTYVVPSHNLLAILQQLRQPLGIADRHPAFSRAQMLQFLGDLDIPDHKGFIHFMETLTALSHNVCGVAVPLCDTTRKLYKQMQKVPVVQKLDRPAHNALSSYYISILQSRWRSYAMRTQFAESQAGAEVRPAGGEDDAASGKGKPNQIAPAP